MTEEKNEMINNKLELEKTIEYQRKKIVQLKKVISSLKLKHETECIEYENKISNIKDEKYNVEGELSDLQKEFKMLQKSYDEVTNEAKRLQDELDTELDLTSNQKKRLLEYENKIKKLSDDLETSAVNNTENMQQIKLLQTKRESDNTNLLNKKKKINELETEKTNLQKQIDDLRLLNETKDKRIEQEEEKRYILEESLIEKETQLNKFISECQKLHLKITDDLNPEIINLKKQLMRSDNKYSLMNKEFENSKKNLEEVKKACAEKTKDTQYYVENMKLKILEHEEENKKKDTTISSIREKLEQQKEIIMAKEVVEENLNIQICEKNEEIVNLEEVKSNNLAVILELEETNQRSIGEVKNLKDDLVSSKQSAKIYKSKHETAQKRLSEINNLSSNINISLPPPLPKWMAEETVMRIEDLFSQIFYWKKKYNKKKDKSDKKIFNLQKLHEDLKNLQEMTAHELLKTKEHLDLEICKLQDTYETASQRSDEIISLTEKLRRLQMNTEKQFELIKEREMCLVNRQSQTELSYSHLQNNKHQMSTNRTQRLAGLKGVITGLEEHAPSRLGADTDCMKLEFSKPEKKENPIIEHSDSCISFHGLSDNVTEPLGGGAVRGKSTDGPLGGKSTDGPLGGKSTDGRLEGKSADGPLGGKSTDGPLGSKSTDGPLVGKSTDSFKDETSKLVSPTRVIKTPRASLTRCTTENDENIKNKPPVAPRSWARKLLVGHGGVK
eukprot:GHVL01021027.1.p1 GENE.GHVL01021027.1~~GHVL01021027.1.p1  ORF type:complete len:729 (-),score=241.57 GHVL01021027.1:1136-3322(-)